MTLLNAPALFAAAGLLVPILIHLHRKRKAQVVEWPAMQFLANTLATRRRGLALENLLLLFVRCVVIMLFVLAVARPILPEGNALRLVGFFLLATGGLIGLAAALTRTLAGRIRVAGAVAAGLLLCVAVFTLNMKPEELASPTANCDLVLVLDESSSMLTDGEEESRFASAVSEAQALVDRLSGSSTVGIVRCGPVIETVAGSPFRDLPAASTSLSELRPRGGGATTKEAIDRAFALARKGPNAFKQVVLFTDDQLQAWESLDGNGFAQTASTASDETADGSDAEDDTDAGEAEDATVHLAIHRASLPKHAVNVSVVSTRIDSPVLAVGQSLLIEADVRNHGDAAVANVDIQLTVDGKRVSVEPIDVLPPATTTTVRFRHEFDTAGKHVVTAQTEFADVLKDDNRHDTVVSVVPFVSVLLVNGNAFAKPGDQSATFVRLSLDPVGGTAAAKEEETVARPIRVESVTVSELGDKESLTDYDLVLLSEVPQLPREIAAKVTDYVKDGGGLWVIPDRQANAAFYNDWKIDETGNGLLPATLLDHHQAAAIEDDASVKQAVIDLQGVADGPVSDLIKTGEHDLAEVSVDGFRKVNTFASAVVGMKLTTGDPLFVEQAVGQGRVLLQTVSLGRRDCNLPQRVCFPVLMHVWSYHLANCQRDETNFEPAPELSVPVSLTDIAGADVETLRLIDPTSEEQLVSVAKGAKGDLAQIMPAARPGLYTLKCALKSALKSQDASGLSQPFTISRDHRESDLAAVSEEKLKALQTAHGFQWFDGAEELQFAGVAELTEQELSPFLLIAVLCFVAAESLLAAWIRRRRKVTASPQQPLATGRMKQAGAMNSPTGGRSARSKRPSPFTVGAGVSE